MAHLETLGIGRIVIPTLLTWDYWHQQPIEETFVEEVVAARDAGFPDRIFGHYGVNPRKRMEGVRELEDAIRHKGFVGMHLHPHGFGLPPNHAWYMPYYAKCAELGAVVVDLDRPHARLHARRGGAADAPRRDRPLLPGADDRLRPHRLAVGGGGDRALLQAPERLPRHVRATRRSTGSRR